MTGPVVTRRALLGLAAGATAALLAACRGEADVGPTTTAIDASFAEPWRALWSDDMASLAGAAALTDPDALAHARDRLTAPGDPDTILATAVGLDVADDELDDVGGWLLPRTYAGLAMGLAILNA